MNEDILEAMLEKPDFVHEFLNGLRVGDRFSLSDGREYNIDRIPNESQQRIRFVPVSGAGGVKCYSPQMFHEMLETGTAIWVNKPLSQAQVELRLVAATPQEKLMFQFRKAIAEALNEFPGRTPRIRQMDVIKSVTETFARRAVKQDLKRPPTPSYPTAKRWAKIQREQTTEHTSDSPLLVTDHRRNPRGVQKKLQAVEPLVQKNIRTLRLRGGKPDTSKEYLELVLSCRETFPGITKRELSEFIPSKRTYYRRAAQYDVFQQSQHQNSFDAHSKKFATGGPIGCAPFIGALVMIDSTQIDVHVKVNLIEVAVRPHLTVAIDVESRVILGWTLSFASPSSRSTVRTLIMSATAEDGQMRVIPASVACDRGPEHKTALDDLGQILHFSVDRSAPRHSNGQAYIETLFATANKGLFHVMGGSTFGTLGQARPSDTKNPPIYDLAMLNQRVAEWVEIYHMSEHSGIGMSPRTRWGLLVNSDRLHVPETITPEYAHSLGEIIAEDRVIKKGFVSAYGVSWGDSTLGTFGESLKKRGLKARLHINPDNLGLAHVSDPDDPSNLKPVRARIPGYQDGLTLEMHLEIKNATKEWKKIAENEDAVMLARAHYYRNLRVDREQAEETVNPTKRVQRGKDYVELARQREQLAAYESQTVPRIPEENDDTAFPTT